jgi:hypothetical protein
MNNFIQGQDGKLAGSISGGKTAVPTARPDIAYVTRVPQRPAPAPDTDSVTHAYGYFTRSYRDAHPPVHIDPQAAATAMETVESLGLDAGNRIMGLRDEIARLRRTAPQDCREAHAARIDEVITAHDVLRRAICWAAGELHEAERDLGMSTLAPVRNDISGVIDADDVSFRAGRLKDMFDADMYSEWSAGKLGAVHRVSSAGRHALSAARLLDVALSSTPAHEPRV